MRSGLLAVSLLLSLCALPASAGSASDAHSSLSGFDAYIEGARADFENVGVAVAVV
ncbi:MAG: hypothetical protein JNL55_25655, partial [Steroidobacter sp.]|nr:hypothetical protein [Steroidobacter sp.]